MASVPDSRRTLQQLGRGLRLALTSIMTNSPILLMRTSRVTSRGVTAGLCPISHEPATHLPHFCHSRCVPGLSWSHGLDLTPHQILVLSCTHSPMLRKVGRRQTAEVDSVATLGAGDPAVEGCLGPCSRIRQQRSRSLPRSWLEGSTAVFGFPQLRVTQFSLGCFHRTFVL